MRPCAERRLVAAQADLAMRMGEIPQGRRKGANKVLQLELSGNRLC